MRNDLSRNESRSISSILLVWGIAGGIIGIAVGVIYNFRILIIPITVPYITFLPFNPIINGTLLGIVIGVIIGGIIAFLSSFDSGHEHKGDAEYSNNIKNNETDSEATMRFHEEQLRISKSTLLTGKIKIHKEIITEEKKIIVPVNREVLVIEKNVYDKDTNNVETIRIPIREERIDVSKHTVPIQEVSINRHRFKETKHITQTLKKEIPHVRKNGDVDLVNKYFDE